MFHPEVSHFERLQSTKALGSMIIPDPWNNDCCPSAILCIYQNIQMGAGMLKQYTVSWQIHASGISWHQTSVASAAHKQMLGLLALCQSEPRPGSHEV